MAIFFRPEHQGDLTLRMQIRASHVYLLFLALLNLISFRVELTLENKTNMLFDRTFRFLLLIAGCVAIFAFLFEHTGVLKERKLTLISVIFSSTSVFFVLLNEAIGFLYARKTSQDKREAS